MTYYREIRTTKFNQPRYENFTFRSNNFENLKNDSIGISLDNRYKKIRLNNIKNFLDSHYDDIYRNYDRIIVRAKVVGFREDQVISNNKIFKRYWGLIDRIGIKLENSILWI